MKHNAVAALILLIAAASTGCSISSASTASPDCSDRAESTIKAEDNDGIDVVARSCGDQTGTGVVSIKTFVDGELAQTFSVPYDSIAYSLNMENKIDLDGDGTPDLSLSTGAGKGGAGTFYWVREKARNQYQPVGDYPSLSLCGSDNGILYSVTPGSGDSISTWTYYKFTDQIVAPLLAVEVTAPTDDGVLRLIDTAYDGTTINLGIASQVFEDEIGSYLFRICSELKGLS